MLQIAGVFDENKLSKKDAARVAGEMALMTLLSLGVKKSEAAAIFQVLNSSYAELWDANEHETLNEEMKKNAARKSPETGFLESLLKFFKSPIA